MNPLLQVKNLSISLNEQEAPLVSDVSFDLMQGSCLGILGESGSGKSILCKAIMRLLPSNFSLSGKAVFWENNLLNFPEKDMRRIRGRQIAMIMQNPLSAFDPLFTIGYQMVETLQAHIIQTKQKSEDLAYSALVTMLIREPNLVLRSYPHQLSGGMLQRIMIGLTLTLSPSIIIADEPTTALDSVTQYEVLKELARIRATKNTTMIFISHDLGALRMLADHVLVMYKGKPVEYGSAKKVFAAPKHEHTKYLIKTRLSLAERFLSVTKGKVTQKEEILNASS